MQFHHTILFKVSKNFLLESDKEADENTGKSNVNTKREEEKGAPSHERRRR